jgi:hypothetical protein
MKNSILLTLLASAGLVLGACSDGKSDADSGTPTGADDGADDGATSAGDDGVTSAGPGGDDAATGAGSDGAMDETGGMPPSGFITRSDGGGGVSFECDLFAQDCMPGEKCMPWSNDGGPAWNATRCSPLDPNPAQTGDACMVEGSGVSGIDNCDIGNMCWNVDETGVGVCEDMCTGSAEAPICENPDDTCSIANDGAISLCLPECDPLIQECDEGQACYPINDAFACAPDASGDPGVHGDACEFINSCDPGNICIGADAHSNCAGAVGCCSSVCSVMDPNSDADCAALDPGQSCEAWFIDGMAPPGYEDTGVCALPV